MEKKPITLPWQKPSQKTQFQTLETDWFGKEETACPAFQITLDENELVFRARSKKSPESAPGCRTNEFFEGLWEYDVAELFLANPANEHYMELHIAPNGAWWSCHFEEVRVRADAHNDPPEGAYAEANEGLEHWEACLRVPLASLPEALAFDPATTRGNVCFCLGTEPRQHYLTWAPPPKGAPDFHRPDAFLPLKPQK